MAYKMEKQSPYNCKKITFGKKVRSTILTLLACGCLITVSGRIANMHRIQEATKQYQTTISSYEEIIKATALYIHGNGGDNPERCFQLYTQLLWNGYLSIEKNYKYDIQDINNIAGHYGARIATGEGDCKNNEDFFCKVMKALDYDAYLVACCIHDAKSPQEMIMGNHVITVVNHNGTEYYFDATNSCSYQKVGVNCVQNENKDMVITLKPLISYIFGYNDEMETIYLVINTSKSGKAFEVEERSIVDGIANSQKILALRKKIIPQLEMICNTITSEG